eukprot:4763835-Heterocapsa_arctica.AAC.1
MPGFRSTTGGMTYTFEPSGRNACKKAVLTSPSITGHPRRKASCRSTRAPMLLGVAAYVSWIEPSLIS